MLKGVFGFPKHLSDIVNQQFSFRFKLLMSTNKRKAEIRTFRVCLAKAAKFTIFAKAFYELTNFFSLNVCNLNSNPFSKRRCRF